MKIEKYLIVLVVISLGFNNLVQAQIKTEQQINKQTVKTFQDTKYEKYKNSISTKFTNVETQSSAQSGDYKRFKAASKEIAKQLIDGAPNLNISKNSSIGKNIIEQSGRRAKEKYSTWKVNKSGKAYKTNLANSKIARSKLQKELFEEGVKKTQLFLKDAAKSIATNSAKPLLVNRLPSFLSKTIKIIGKIDLISTIISSDGTNMIPTQFMFDNAVELKNNLDNLIINSNTSIEQMGDISEDLYGLINEFSPNLISDEGELNNNLKLYILELYERKRKAEAAKNANNKGSSDGNQGDNNGDGKDEGTEKKMCKKHKWLNSKYLGYDLIECGN